jgi:hypothetical protein
MARLLPIESAHAAHDHPRAAATFCMQRDQREYFFLGASEQVVASSRYLCFGFLESLIRADWREGIFDTIAFDTIAARGANRAGALEQI